MSTNSVGALQVEIIHGREIDPGLSSCWQGILDICPEYLSPYLTPAYTQIVAQVREETRVALLRRDGQLVGFFPFELIGDRTAGPVGNHFNDYQAVVCAPSTSWSLSELLIGADIDEFVFDHLLAHQHQFHQFTTLFDFSAIIDLPEGFSGYRRDMKESGRGRISRSEQNQRRLNRRFSEVVFTTHRPNENDLATLLAWKREQRARTGFTGHYSAPWENDLIRRLAFSDEAAFSGVLSTLHADGKLIAAELGLRSRSVWHGWIPSYAPEFSALSPGHVLFLHMLKASDEMGISRMDLGKGLARYKQELMTGYRRICEGVAHLTLIAGQTNASPSAHAPP